MDARKFKNIALGSMTSVLLTIGQGAFAHTELRDEVPEGKTIENATQIHHGCAPLATAGQTPVPQIPVIAMSVLFPNSADSVWTILNADGTSKAPTTLAATMDGVAPVLLIAPDLIQNRNVFQNCREVADPSVKVNQFGTSNVRGIKCPDGLLSLDSVGETPFEVAGPTFKASSCAKSLQVRIAIANWCTKSANPDDNGRVDVWMGHMTTLFNDPDVMPSVDFQTNPFWPTMTINRDLTKNPLPGGCDPVTGYDVAVEPSDADIDAHLPMKGFWPKNAQ